MDGRSRRNSGCAALRGCLRTAVGVHRFLGYYRGNSVLENQLFLVAGFEHNRIFIETLDSARQLDAAHKVNRKNNFVFSCII